MAISIDPAVIGGWLGLLSIVALAFWRVGVWISRLIAVGQKIIEEMGQLRTDVTNLQRESIGYRTAIGFLLGQSGQDLNTLDELLVKANPAEAHKP